MIFKTLNGDLTVFSKTLISTKDQLKALETINTTVHNNNGTFNLQGVLVNSSQSVSTFTKLNNAFNTYNDNLSKSTQLQNAYVQAVGKQNTSLGNYLAGLNGTKASMGGYIKHLIAAKAASIGLQVASATLNTVLSMGISFAISGLISQISKWIHGQDEARQKAIELTNSYKEQKNTLDSQIEKYKELKESLDKGNLSTNETRSVKEQLLEIQNSLIESYGDEVSNIDLVNGKYREQLGLLGELSKEKATDYVIENRDAFGDAKKELEKIRTYNIGTVAVWSSYLPITEKQQTLFDYIESYSNLFKLTPTGGTYGSTNTTSYDLLVKANVEDADNIMHQFAEDLEQFGKDNDIDVSGLLEGISVQLKKTWTDELTEYKTIYDEFMKAEVVRNDTLRPLYQQSIQAVENYNKALSSGEGVAEAKANLDTVQQSVQNATGELAGSQEVFDGIYDGINKNAENAYNLQQSFENNESVKEYAEQLKGLTDFDLKAINFQDNIQSPGEEAFGALIDILGLSEEELQNLIDKLVELGYVQGEVQNSTANNKNEEPISFSEAWNKLGTESDEDTAKASEKAKEKLLQLAEAGKLTVESFKDISITEQFLKDTGLSAEEATQKINEMKSSADQLASMRTGIASITSAYNEKKNSETNTISRSTLESMYDTLGVDEWDNKNKEVWKNYKKCAANGKTSMGSLKKAQDELATSFVNSNNFLANLDGTSDDYYETLLKQMGVENADTIVKNELTKKKGLEAIETADLTNMTSDEIAKLIEEKGKTDDARNAMKLFALEKVYANGKALDTTEDINQLINLMDSLGLSTNAVKAYRDYLSGKSENSDVLGANAVIETGLKASALNEINKARNKLKGKGKNGGEKISTGKNKDSSDNLNKGKTKETKTEIDWLSRRLTRMQSIIDLTAAKLQNLFSIKAKNSNLNRQIRQTNTLMKQYSIAAKKYQKKADSVANGSTSKIKSNKNKGKKKKVKPLSKDIIKKIQSGKITKSSYSKLIKKYGQSNADRINQYIDYFDKAQDARKNKQDAQAKARGLKQEKLQNWVDLYDSRTARAEAKESILTNAKDKNEAIDTQIKNTNKSYAKQIKIAELSRDKAGKDRLGYELQQKITELEQKKLQNYVDEYNASAGLAEISSNNAIGYEKQNGFISEQLSWLQKSYDKQIEIAGLAKDKTEQDRLQAEYEAKKAELKQQQIDNIKTDYENKISLINNGKQDISNSLAETEARGDIVQAGFYSSLNSYENSILAALKEELQRLQGEQNTFDIYSQEWYDLQSDIQSVENSISETNISIIENNKKIGELRQAMYDDIATRNSDASSEAQFLAGLLGDNLIDDKTGSLTKEGLGVLGTYGIELKANESSAETFRQNREEIEGAIARFNSGDTHAIDIYGSLEKAKEELKEVIKKEQEAITAEYSSMKNIYDLMVQKYDAQLSYMKSIIDAKKQVLDMEKDLYDYEKNISNQTKNIATLEKQLTALKGDDSEEGRAKRAKLQVSLDEANQELQDTEYERYISDQQNMLDNMYAQYEDLLTALEKDFETVVNEGIKRINETAGGISHTLNDIAKNYNYVTTGDMTNIMNSFKESGLDDLKTVFGGMADDTKNDYDKNQTTTTGTSGSGTSGNSTTSSVPTEVGTPPRDAVIEQGYKDEVSLFLAEHSGEGDEKPLRPVKKDETEASFSSALNKKLSQFGYIVKTGTGSHGMKYINMFAQFLGIMSGDSSFKSSGAVYKALQKKYPNAGFRTGGIVRADGVPKDGDNVPVRVNPNETILTQDFTKMLPDSVDTMKHFVNATDYTKLMKPKAIGNNFGNIIVTAELPNVSDAQDFVSEFQNSKRIQKAFEIGVRDCLSHGRITNNIQNII